MKITKKLLEKLIKEEYTALVEADQGVPKVRGRIDTIATPAHPSSRAARRTQSQDFTPGGQTEPVARDSFSSTFDYGPGGHGGMSRVPPAARKLVKMVERALKREGGPAECAENFLFTIADLMGSRDPLMDRLDEARVIASNIIATGFAGHLFARKYYGALKRDLSPKCFKFLVKQTKKARGEGPAPLDDTADELGSLPPLDEGKGKIVCPNCGHHNEAGVGKCSKCGHPRNKGSWKSVKSEVNKFDQPDAGEAEQRARETARRRGDRGRPPRPITGGGGYDTGESESARKLRATYQKYAEEFGRLRKELHAVRSKMEQIEAMQRRAGYPSPGTYYREDD